MNILVCVLVLCASAVFAEEEGGFPMLELANDELTMGLYLPDAEKGYYRGTRFDWSGIIERVEYKGHRFYGAWRFPHDPTGHDFVSGPAEEFGMDHPSGFDEVEAGGSFVKVGVGLLQKGEDAEYKFHGAYKIIRAGEWEVEHGENWVEFRQDFVGERGWAYKYKKRIELDGAGFAIEHRLENTGEKTIDINHYNHNFTSIDGVPYGPDYSVLFPFAAKEPKDIRADNPGLAWYRGNQIEVEQKLGDQSLWVQVHEGAGPVEYNAGMVRCDKTGAAVSFKGDTPIIKYNFWSVETAACPEPFIGINLAPGQAQEWTNDYVFSADEK
ncbi:MAG: hypothetical protein VX293_11460 [Candidatus Latescibacterota bacterium]|nr:hypothetical protein [Candidatus Latescibacterota bacterium]